LGRSLQGGADFRPRRTRLGGLLLPGFFDPCSRAGNALQILEVMEEIEKTSKKLNELKAKLASSRKY
jgi:hypothetical protein